VTGIAVAALIIAVPAVAFTLWPLRRGSRARRILPLPADPRERLLEDKHRILGALRELGFEHDAGHVSDEDYTDLLARYEEEAAAILGELDRMTPVAPPPPAPGASAVPRAPVIDAGVSPRSAWRHPLTVGAGALGLVLFGIALGAGVIRNTAPDPMAGQPVPGSRPLADLAMPQIPDARGAGAAGGGTPRPVSPEMLQGMLQAARGSLFAGRYGEAIAAYQAVLKRHPGNVDALAHLGLIVAIGGHADTALQTLDQALAIDPNYPPALLFRGQILDEVKHDVPGAIRSWEKFVAVAPAGEDRERVVKLIADARSRAAKAPK
jgi:hypothetical protein